MNISALKGSFKVMNKTQTPAPGAAPAASGQPKNISDLQGKFKVMPKAPEASSLSKALTGAGKVFNDVSTGIAKKELETVKGIGEIGGSLVNWVMGKGFTPNAEGGLNSEKSALKDVFNDKNLESKNTSESVGKGIATVGEFFVPAGAEEMVSKDIIEAIPKAAEFLTDEAGNLTKFGKAAAYGIRSLTRGLSGGAVTAAQTGDLKEGAKMGGTIAALDIPLNWAGKLAEGIFSHLASFVSGKGKPIIDAIKSEPESALKGMQTDIGTGLRKTVRALQQYASDTYKIAKDKYAADLEKIEEKYLPSNKDFMKQGNKSITPTGTQTLSLQGIKSKLTSVFNDFGVEGDFGKGFNFSNAPSASLERILNNAYTSIKNFTDITPKGINNLIRRLDGIAERTKLPEAISAMGQITKNIQDYLGERVPEIGQMNAKYAKSMKFLEDMNNYLKTGIKGGIKEGMNSEGNIEKISNEIATIFNDHKEVARQWIEGMLPEGKKIISEQAGRLMKNTGAAKNIFSKTLEAVPPRLVGWLTARGSQLSSILGKLNPAEQGIIREIFGHAMGDQDQAVRGGTMSAPPTQEQPNQESKPLQRALLGQPQIMQPAPQKPQ